MMATETTTRIDTWIEPARPPMARCSVCGQPQRRDDMLAIVERRREAHAGGEWHTYGLAGLPVNEVQVLTMRDETPVRVIRWYACSQECAEKGKANIEGTGGGAA